MARTLRCEVDSLEQNLLLHCRPGLSTPLQLAYRQTQRLNHNLTAAGYRVGLGTFQSQKAFGSPSGTRIFVFLRVMVQDSQDLRL